MAAMCYLGQDPKYASIREAFQGQPDGPLTETDPVSVMITGLAL